MREEADYPPSFCVWDQDQQANPPLGEERRGEGSKGRGGAGVVRRAKDNEWTGGGRKKEMTEGVLKKGEGYGRKDQRPEKEMGGESYDFALCALIWHIQCNQIIAHAGFTCHASLCAYMIILSFM